jgi:uncharacterized membrane protein
MRGYLPGLILAAGLLAAGAGQAQAKYDVCNHTAYILDAALAIEVEDAAATQGWFRIFPGTCDTLIDDKVSGERIFLHTRAPDFYGRRPAAGKISRLFCVGRSDFLLAGASRCADDNAKMVPFSDVGSDFSDGSAVTVLTDAPGDTARGARERAIRKLLALAGYLPERDGDETRPMEPALQAFLADHAISARDAIGSHLFEELANAAQAAAAGGGLTLCNSVAYPVYAAIGLAAEGRIETKGWHEIGRNSCDTILAGPLEKAETFVYAEARAADGKPPHHNGHELVWRGGEIMCTEFADFAISQQGNCERRGLAASGFRRFKTPRSGKLMVRFTYSNAR